MIYRALIILIVMSTSIVLGQEYLPLQVGNSWSLSEIETSAESSSDSLSGYNKSRDSLFIQVVGDTLMPDGKTYAVLNTGLGLGKFIRSDSASIYYYDDITLTEIPVFNFNAELYAQEEISFHDSAEKYFISLESIKQDTSHGSSYRISKFHVKGHKEFTASFSEASGLCEYSEAKERNYEYKLASSVLNEKAFSSPTNAAPSRQEPASSYTLNEKYPAPFCPISYIYFSLPKSSQVTITIYDILGHAVATIANGYYPAGQYKASLRELDIPNGVYVFRLEAGDLKRIGKWVFTK